MTIIKYSMFLVIGMVLSYAGIHPTDWLFYAVLTPAAIAANI